MPLSLPRFARMLAAGLMLAVFAAAVSEAATGMVVVPPGNRSPVQPEISSSSVARTAETKGDFDSKYKAIYDALASDRGLMVKIVRAARQYDIDPIHIVGAIVGEHTYNVDVFDSLQGYAVKALAYLNTPGLTFAYHGLSIEQFVARPEFAPCTDQSSDFVLWDCRERIWRDKFRGRTVDGVAFPNDRFGRVFFQPFFVGQTFGLGQLNPLAALAVSDRVHATSGLPLLDMRHAPEVYRAVMDPDITLAYMAATIREEIDIYRSVAGFDISSNPGITATLYNTGDVIERAQVLAADNKKRRAQGWGPSFPRENYYGWLINDRLDELKKLVPAS
jgi:hypothetical protein